VQEDLVVVPLEPLADPEDVLPELPADPEDVLPEKLELPADPEEPVDLVVKPVEPKKLKNLDVDLARDVRDVRDVRERNPRVRGTSI